MRLRRVSLLALVLGAGPLAAQEALVSRADSLATAGDTGAALALLDQAVRQRPNAAPAWHRRGVLAWHMARRAHHKGFIKDARDIKLLEMADTSLRLAAQFAPDSARFHLDLGNFLLSSGYSVVRFSALSAFQKGLKAAVRVGDSLLISRAADEVGMAFWRRYEPHQGRVMLPPGTPLPALDSLVQAAPKDLDNAVEMTARGRDEPGLLDYLKASELFVRALRANPNNPSALKHVFMSLAEQERWEEMRRLADLRLAAAAWDPWAWLARGLASHRLGRAEDARAAYDSALTFLSPHDRARYTSLSRIVRPADSARLAAMTPADREATERMYWVVSDPLALTPGNEHWLEFLSRVAFAELRWTSEDWELRGADTDRGVVYVRYGPPQTVTTFPPDGFGLVSLLWRYPDGMSFLFTLRPGLGVAHLSFNSASNAEALMREYPVRWTNVPVTRTLDSISTQLARFRATGDSSDVVVYARVPVGRMARGRDVRSGPVDFALIVFDGAARLVVRDSSRETIQFDALDSTSAVMRAWRRRLPSVGSLGVRVEALERAAMRGARTRGVVDVGATRGFGMSDVLVVDRLSPRAGPAPERWSDMFSTPSVGELRRGQQFGVLWETYEMTATPDGAHRYSVELGLRRVDRSAVSRLVARIIAGTTRSAEARARDRAQHLTLAFTRQTPARPVALDYLTLDLGDTPPGRYRLTITVTDLTSRQSATRERELTIVR